MNAYARLTVPALLMTTTLALGCGSDSGSLVDPNGSGDGSLSFAFSGTPSGSFSASGPVHETSPSWARARRSSNTFEVVAFNARSATRGDVAFIDVAGTGTGTYSITDFEADFDFLVNTNASATLYDRWCILETGVVNITTASATRVRGTFSGAGDCWDGDDDVEPFAVSNGTFDVPIENS